MNQQTHRETLTLAQLKILSDNIQAMLNALKTTSSSIQEQFPEFSVSRSTLDRWINCETPNPRKSAAEQVLKFINRHFENKLGTVEDLYNKNWVPGRIISSLSKLLQSYYQGDYYLYYLSTHTTDSVHAGRLLITSEDEDTLKVRMVMGIYSDTHLTSELLSEIFNPTTAEPERLFEQFRTNMNSELSSICHYYEGHVCKEDQYVRMEMHGMQKYSSHQEQLILSSRFHHIKEGRHFQGGLGLFVALPNPDHPSLRTFRMGVSRYPFSIQDDRLLRHLTQTEKDPSHIVLSDDDDKQWYSMVMQSIENMK